MDEGANHILNKYGILKSFSISKKFTEEELNFMAKKLKRGKSEEELVEMLKAKIVEEIMEASEKGTLPGMILNQKRIAPIPIQGIETLNKMVEIISHKIRSKNLDKMSLCYFINFLVGSLGLSEEDFEEFHRKVSEAQGEDPDDDDED